MYNINICIFYKILYNVCIPSVIFVDGWCCVDIFFGASTISNGRL